MSHASATAEPPDEPPALSRGSKGFPVAPHTRLRVFAPAPNSGTLVLQRMIAPASRTSATMAAKKVKLLAPLPKGIGVVCSITYPRQPGARLEARQKLSKRGYLRDCIRTLC